jgi:hypothetical protein
MTNEKYRPFDEDQLLAQIGRMNIFAISGGRVQIWRTNDGKAARTVTLPVSNGYSVEIHLAWDDTYTVTRRFKRKGEYINKGTIEGVYCENIGEVAYQASCFRSNKDFGKVAA